MQKITVILTIVGIFFLLNLYSPAVDTAISAECAYLNKKIKKERDLLKRRGLYVLAVDRCPEDAGVHYGYGFVLERLRRYEEAIHQYSLATELDGNMARAYFNIGDIYRSQGKMDPAIAAYQQGLLIDPENSRAKKNLDKVLKAAEKMIAADG